MTNVTLFLPLIIVYTLLPLLIQSQNSRTCSDVTYISDIDRDRLRQTASTFKSTFQLFQNLPIDMVFVLESSGSIGADFFDCELQFVNQLTSMFSISYNLTRIGVVVFSSCDKIYTYVDYIGDPIGKNKCTFKEDIDNVKYSGGGTCTGGGLRRAEALFKSSPRLPAHRITILLTEGYSTEGESPISVANDIRRIGGKVFAIGLGGGVIRQELLRVAGNSDNRLFLLEFTSDIAVLGEAIQETDLKDHASWDVSIQSTACNNICNEFQNCCDENASCACASQSGSVDCACHPGFAGFGYRESCSECPIGTYKPQYGNQQCTKCPHHSTTRTTGRTSIADCSCQIGYHGDPENGVACSPVLCEDLSGHLSPGVQMIPYNCDRIFGTVCQFVCRSTHRRIGGQETVKCLETGQWSGSALKCRHRRRKTACDPLLSPEDGQWSCSNDNLEIGTTCSVLCNSGYHLVGNADRQCILGNGIMGVWTGVTATCKPNSCPQLVSKPNMKIKPSYCEGSTLPYGTLCRYSCKRTYRLEGSAITRCLADGTWSDTTFESRCVDNKPPTITCPGNIQQTADSLRDSTEVMWSSPTGIADNSGIAPIVTSSHTPPATFFLGESEVTYEATDAAGLQTTCTFIVSVTDDESPRVLFCPPDLEIQSYRTSEAVTWEQPIFIDNSGHVTEVVGSHKNGTVFAVKNIGHLISYLASDAAGNHAYCNFTVAVKQHHCPHYEPPLNGALTCERRLHNRFCTVSCDENYEFSREPDVSYFCANIGNTMEMEWQPPPYGNQQFSMPWPDCSIKYDRKAQREMSLSYNAYGCGNKAVFDEIKRNFIAKYNAINEFCSNGCSVEDFLIECRPAFGPVVGRRRRQTERVVVNVVVITFQASYDTSRKKPQLQARNHPTNKPNPVDILAQVVSNMQIALHLGNLTLSVGSDLLHPDKNSFIVSDEITYPCDTGEILRNGICVLCPPGTFYNSAKSECTNCGRGKYQPDYGQTECFKCPLGTTTAANNINAKFLSDCKAFCGPGTYSSTGLQTCNVCPVGSYQPLTGRDYCHTCQTGLTTWTEGSFSLDHCTGPCPRGTFSETGLEPCKPCPRGTFQTELGQTTCTSCPVGQYTHNEGVSTPRFCQVVNECDDFAPCQNGGSCRDFPRGYECQCMPGYYGQHCEIEIDECIDKPCKNNGVCSDMINGYRCTCPIGFEGVNCQINIDDCVNSECDNGAECVDGINEYKCACAPGFTGELCQINLFDCASSPCLNDAKCVDLASNYTCCCLPGYSGRHCEYAEDGCISSPCMHNGTCTTQANTFKCDCAPGYNGRRCEFEINECVAENVTCHNGGTCHDLIGGYKCTCLPRYGGPYCETELASDFDLIFPSARSTNYALVQTLPDLYAFTLAFWMRTADQSNLGTPVSYANFGNDGTFVDNALTLHNYNNFVLFINGESVHTDVKANEYSSWIHIAVTWQGIDGSWDIYINGFLFASGTDLQAGSYIRGGGSLIIGQEQDSFAGSFVRSEAFIGELSQLNIWNFRMTANEVKRKFETCLSDDNSGNALSWYDVPYRLRGEVRIQGPSNICQRIDDCHSLPCRNGGTCEDLFRSYVCKCQSGFHGDHCEHRSQNCRQNSCNNGGSCHDKGEGFFCSCLPGFSGAFCQVPVNLCRGVYCLNGGTCRSLSSGHKCLCRSGFAGRFCEYDVDECLIGNGGCDHNCHNTQGSFYCTCYGGFALQPDGYTCLAKALCVHHGQIHLRGETWNDSECSECSCRNGRPVCRPQRHSCPALICSRGEEEYLPPGACCSICIAVSRTCAVSRRYEFDTFDHFRYEQLGDCRYVLSEDYVSSAFSVEIEFENEDFGSLRRRMIILHAGCVDVTIDFEGKVQVAGIDVELPYSHGNPKSVEIWRNTTFSERDVFIKTDRGVRLHWTMLDAVTLSVPKTFSNDLLGLCGNMNGQREDDMLTRQFLPGRSPKEFMHSWKVDGYKHCKSLQNLAGTASSNPTTDSSLLFEHLSPENLPACQGVSQALLRAARDTCNILRSNEFLRCHRDVSIELYYELCLQDVCSCNINEPCYCQSLTAYTRECQRNGIRVSWSDPACTIQCPTGMLYDHCGPACLQTCTSHTQSDWCRQQPCRPRCQCPAGNVLHNGNCIPANSCPVN